MKDINSVILVGRLTRDPELRSLPSGTSVCDIGLAQNDSRKDASGSWVDVPQFFDVSAFGKLGENVAAYKHKGEQIVVRGRLSFRQWTTDAGEKRSKVSVVADDIQFIGAKGAQQEQGGAPYNDAGLAPANSGFEDDDSIPF